MSWQLCVRLLMPATKGVEKYANIPKTAVVAGE